MARLLLFLLIGLSSCDNKSSYEFANGSTLFLGIQPPNYVTQYQCGKGMGRKCENTKKTPKPKPTKNK